MKVPRKKLRYTVCPRSLVHFYVGHHFILRLIGHTVVVVVVVREIDDER